MNTNGYHIKPENDDLLRAILHARHRKQDDELKAVGSFDHWIMDDFQRRCNPDELRIWIGRKRIKSVIDNAFATAFDFERRNLALMIGWFGMPSIIQIADGSVWASWNAPIVDDMGLFSFYRLPGNLPPHPISKRFDIRIRRKLTLSQYLLIP